MRRSPSSRPAAPLLALLALLVALLAAAGPAAAQSFSIPTGLGDGGYAGAPGAGSEGPVLAGDGRVLWLEERGTGAALVVARHDGARTDVLALPPFRSRGLAWQLLTVVADGDRAVVQRVGFTCPGSGNACSGVDRRAAYDLVAVDLATGAARPLDGCLGDAECEGCRARSGWSGYELRLSGSVLALRGCMHGLLDLATGATTRLPSGAVVALAGSRAVLGTWEDEVDPGTFRLADWRTGALVRPLPGFKPYGREEAGRIALGADGTVAYTTLDGVETVAPAGARHALRRSQGEDRIAHELLFAGGLLAEWRVVRESYEDRAHVRVQRPDGTGARETGGQLAGGGWGAAEGRVAWAVRPCAQTVVQVWELAGPPPAPAPDVCTMGKVATAPVRITRGGRLPVTSPARRPRRRGARGTSARGSGRRRAAATSLKPTSRRTRSRRARPGRSTSASRRCAVPARTGG